MPGWKNVWLKLTPSRLQYLGMALTKLGNSILRQAGQYGRKAMRFAFPAMTTAVAANDILSGERSVGGAIGDAAGGIAGFEDANALTRAYTKKLQSPKLRGALNFAVPAIAAFAGADVASSLGRKLMPWRRSPVTASEWYHNNSI